jgi:molybdenum cofactor cytidylyltransferase
MDANKQSSVYALVLAAGRASRYGRTKQCEAFDGIPLVRRAADSAAAVCGNRVLLVAGHDWRRVSEAGLVGPGFFVRNEDYDGGLGTSLALGVRAVRHVASAVLVTLADQPLVTGEHLACLVEAWSGASDEIVATAYGGTAGAPVLFPSGCFEDLAALEGDSGGKHLLGDPRFKTKTVAFEPAAVDIDTPDDLARL